MTDPRTAELLAARIERDVMPVVNRPSHPMYRGDQVSAPLASAVWSEVVISAVNNSQAVREMSPVGTGLEERVTVMDPRTPLRELHDSNETSEFPNADTLKVGERLIKGLHLRDEHDGAIPTPRKKDSIRVLSKL